MDRQVRRASEAGGPEPTASWGHDRDTPGRIGRVAL